MEFGDENTLLEAEFGDENMLLANYDFFASTAHASVYKQRVYKQYQEIQETCMNDYSAWCSADEMGVASQMDLFQWTNLFHSGNTVVTEYDDDLGSTTIVNTAPVDEYIIIEGTDDLNEMSMNELSLINQNNLILSNLLDLSSLDIISLFNNDDNIFTTENTRRKLVQSRAVIPSLASALDKLKKDGAVSKAIRPVSEVMNKPNKLIDYHNTIQYGGTNPLLKGPGGVRRPPSHVSIKPVSSDSNVVHDHVMKHESSHGNRNLQGNHKFKSIKQNHIKNNKRAHKNVEDSNPGANANIGDIYSKVGVHNPDTFNGYLGFGTAGDMCMYHNFQGLSPKCQSSIKGLYALRNDYLASIEAPSDGSGFFGFIFWLTVVLFSIKITKWYINRGRTHQMNQILRALNNNAELKNAVETASGVTIPSVRKDSFLTNAVKFLGLFVCTMSLILLTVIATVFFGALIINIGSSSLHPAASYIVGALLTVMVIGAICIVTKGVCTSYSYCYGSNIRESDPDKVASPSTPSGIFQSTLSPQVLTTYLNTRDQYLPLLQQDQVNNGSAEMNTYTETTIQPIIKPMHQTVFVSNT